MAEASQDLEKLATPGCRADAVVRREQDAPPSWNLGAQSGRSVVGPRGEPSAWERVGALWFCDDMVRWE